ncbi:unnamed protein product [marine sediment metagenome]|uniref:Uncharacterized protein n=1 Tax=marine sediment metagenome TaxID=412755 RepID=X1C2W7_9ZZZZ
MDDEMNILNYIGIGMCIMAFVGFTPLVFQSFGISLEMGILISAVGLGILIPIFLYFKIKEHKEGMDWYLNFCFENNFNWFCFPCSKH